MIINASIAILRREDASPDDVREVVADVEEETRRLNRIVTEVLDFAKPITFELAETDLNEVCRASAAAAWAGKSLDEVALDLDPRVGPIVSDAERLRAALINLLTNARHAVMAAAARRADRGVGPKINGTPAVTVSTRREPGGVVISIRDRGIGIEPDDMAHIFDPYFTTRRAGTGLGLPIAKNIIEGLHGTIAVSSTRGAGTEIRITLPAPPERRA
jgi:two-component system sensor histidine kinase HydH